MNGRTIGLSALLAGFLALTGIAVYDHGYLGFFRLVTANAATVTALADLVIALGLVLAWMQADARERGISILPYLVVTLALGSAGPLLYLIRRSAMPARHAVRAITPA